MRRLDLCRHLEAADEDSVDRTVAVAERRVDEIEVHVLEPAALRAHEAGELAARAALDARTKHVVEVAEERLSPKLWNPFDHGLAENALVLAPRAPRDRVRELEHVVGSAEDGDRKRGLHEWP